MVHLVVVVEEKGRKKLVKVERRRGKTRGRKGVRECEVNDHLTASSFGFASHTFLCETRNEDEFFVSFLFLVFERRFENAIGF